MGILSTKFVRVVLFVFAPLQTITKVQIVSTGTEYAVYFFCPAPFGTVFTDFGENGDEKTFNRPSLKEARRTAVLRIGDVPEKVKRAIPGVEEKQEAQVAKLKEMHVALLTEMWNTDYPCEHKKRVKKNYKNKIAKMKKELAKQRETLSDLKKDAQLKNISKER